MQRGLHPRRLSGTPITIEFRIVSTTFDPSKSKLQVCDCMYYTRRIAEIPVLIDCLSLLSVTCRLATVSDTILDLPELGCPLINSTKRRNFRLVQIESIGRRRNKWDSKIEI